MFSTNASNVYDVIPIIIEYGNGCSEVAMQLVGWETVGAGRVEICCNGQWGTICADIEEEGRMLKLPVSLLDTVELSTQYCTTRKNKLSVGILGNAYISNSASPRKMKWLNSELWTRLWTELGLVASVSLRILLA